MRMARPPRTGSGIVRLRAKVDKSRRHLAPVAKLESAFAEAAPGDDSDGIRCAAVDFDIGDEALAVADRLESARVVDAQLPATKHRHAHAEDLSGAEVAVGYFCFMKEGFEALHDPILAG